VCGPFDAFYYADYWLARFGRTNEPGYQCHILAATPEELGRINPGGSGRVRCRTNAVHISAPVRGVLEAIARIETGEFRSGAWQPEKLADVAPYVRGRLRPPMRQADRAIDWRRDKTTMIVRKIRAADSAPGVLGTLLGKSCFLYGAHEEPRPWLSDGNSPSCDWRWQFNLLHRTGARSGVVLNPHYRSMGELYGSEYWTYTLPALNSNRFRRSKSCLRITVSRHRRKLPSMLIPYLWRLIRVSNHM